ncbi:hypothetical protein SMACR_08953 [Sordaria macrospora]|uniref:WGS project CABT00000000 data, contig 2.23 n=2 Tax=Sordaria macrospora TaxID=5147 RepID=F7W2U9_SORMK|nr:uncharacterized protein SMAC_08953 [Sordaria macrospora k-hell]KAA8624226.1 hypothetical protein SMACR_08953 [Sordaria macrospora]KAH7631245.1 hypothetical protein B0T09DRAFT_305834 [Sordaria sp. MPI-SDFR-AT-0083]WPJ61664.1 hypothetical protein SMAC4_08953 [Sordaria macrospora]CCC11950.1 unnamed protein product [Sordaria macrospora k-hell]
MTLSEEQKEIISERPLGHTLDRVRDNLRDSNKADGTYRESITSLLGALILSPAAHSLSSPDGYGTVTVRLLGLRQDVQGGKIANLDPFRPLVRLAVDNSDGNHDDNANDNAIWAAVFSVLDTLAPSTPPFRPTTLPTFKGTPIKISSSWFANSANRIAVERELFAEIGNCTFRNVAGFMDKFFNYESWGDEYKAMLRNLMIEHDGNKWKGFPATRDEKLVWKWLRSLEDGFLADAPYMSQVGIGYIVCIPSSLLQAEHRPIFCRFGRLGICSPACHNTNSKPPHLLANLGMKRLGGYVYTSANYGSDCHFYIQARSYHQRVQAIVQFK